MLILSNTLSTDTVIVQKLLSCSGHITLHYGEVRPFKYQYLARTFFSQFCKIISLIITPNVDYLFRWHY